MPFSKPSTSGGGSHSYELLQILARTFFFTTYASEEVQYLISPSAKILLLKHVPSMLSVYRIYRKWRESGDKTGSSFI